MERRPPRPSKGAGCCHHWAAMGAGGGADAVRWSHTTDTTSSIRVAVAQAPTHSKTAASPTGPSDGGCALVCCREASRAYFWYGGGAGRGDLPATSSVPECFSGVTSSSEAGSPAARTCRLMPTALSERAVTVRSQDSGERF